MTPARLEAESRKYNCCGVLRLSDGTFAFLGPGYRVVEAGITAARLIDLILEHDATRRLYEPTIRAYEGPIRRPGAKIDLEDLE